MSVTFRQLEVFIEAAKDCNFRKTADRLGISQPSISNQIRALERWAGCEVFERSRGATPRLSRRGETVLAEAQQLMAGRVRLARNVETGGLPKEKIRLRVAAGPYILDHYIRTALPRFLEKHADIALDFMPTGGAMNMRRAVRRGEADIAVFTVGRSARQLAGAELISEVPCSLYGSPRLARMAARSSTLIESLPFIFPPCWTLDATSTTLAPRGATTSPSTMIGSSSEARNFIPACATSTSIASIVRIRNAVPFGIMTGPSTGAGIADSARAQIATVGTQQLAILMGSPQGA
jgi:DNA-binding transcriptional LysR family regulator